MHDLSRNVPDEKCPKMSEFENRVAAQAPAGAADTIFV
jgi:hypothetical protein